MGVFVRKRASINELFSKGGIWSFLVGCHGDGMEVIIIYKKRSYMMTFHFGLQKFILKENV